MANTEKRAFLLTCKPSSYPGDVLPIPNTTKEILPIKYGTKKPQSCISQQALITDKWESWWEIRR